MKCAFECGKLMEGLTETIKETQNEMKYCDEDTKIIWRGMFKGFKNAYKQIERWHKIDCLGESYIILK